MTTEEFDEFEARWNAMPEGKLELIDGQLIISSRAGSRHIAWCLLDDYGPPIALPHASSELWWRALAVAFQPPLKPVTPNEWWQWAQSHEYDAQLASAGPHFSGPHRRTYEPLMWGLHHFGEVTQLGTSLGRDFVVRLGADGLTPDLIFIDRDRLPKLHEYYLDGPAAVTIEIVQPGSEAQDRNSKWRLYERAKVPEYWLFDPVRRDAIFWRLQPDGSYHSAQPDAGGVYRSAAVPGLALSLPELWSMRETDWQNRWRPFLPCDIRCAQPKQKMPRDKDDLGWDHVPFTPRLALEPIPIMFEEFVSWCGRAKFERYGGGLKIDGSEATRRICAMLIMTFGLAETVKLAHPRDWVSFLAPELHQPLAGQHTATLLGRAVYEERAGFSDGMVYSAEIPGIDAVTTYADSKLECDQELTAAVRNWVLLRLARGEAIPA